MVLEIVLPKLSDAMMEGTLVKWLVESDDIVNAQQPIAEIETDKAVVELATRSEGKVVELMAAEGDVLAVGSILLAIRVEEDAMDNQKVSGPVEAVPVESGFADRTSAPMKRIPGKNHGRLTSVVASPAARRLARELEIDLSTVVGNGPGGRILLSDVERATDSILPRNSAGLNADNMSDNLKKAIKVRQIMARKMVDAWTTIPHFYVTFSVDMTDIIRFRGDLQVTINDFILAAAAKALQEHPWVNSWWVDGEAVEQTAVNLSMAVATDRGLYNPVIHHCEDLNLRQISDRSAKLAKKAVQGKLDPADLDQGTFSISNMGMLGVESFRAIITPPQAAVLAVGTVRGEVIVDESGEPAVAPIAKLTLAADHRILDGADAAEFMATLKSYLEAPVTLIG